METESVSRNDTTHVTYGSPQIDRMAAQSDLKYVERHACMDTPEDSGKRRRVDVADRLSELPDCLLHDVLSRLGSRQAARTCVLSRRWRHLWRDVPCVDLNHRDFRRESGFVDFADMVTTLPAKTPLDAFRLHLNVCYEHKTDSPCSRWLSRGLRRLPAAVHVRGGGILWPHTAAGFARVARLHLLNIGLPAGFGELLGEQFPVLEDLHIEGCMSYGAELTGITSRTLRSLAVVDHRSCSSGTNLVRSVPRLASLRLDLINDGVRRYGFLNVDYAGAPPPLPAPPVVQTNEPLPSVVEASICVREKENMGINYQYQRRRRKQRQQELLRSMPSLLARLPAVTNLRLHGFTAEGLLEEESQEFPVLHNLRTLVFQGCEVGVKSEIVKSVLLNTPNLEKLGLHHCKSSCRPIPKSKIPGASKRGRSAASALVCKNLNLIEIKSEQNEHALMKVLSQILTDGKPLEIKLFGATGSTTVLLEDMIKKSRKVDNPSKKCKTAGLVPEM